MDKSGSARSTVFWLVFPALVLALGHTLSSMLRTMPSIAADVIAVDLRVAPGTIASLASAYHFAFAAGQIPVGIALDRYGVRNVSLVLLAAVAVSASTAWLVHGPVGFLLMQIALGLACCGMLLAPMTLVAKTLPPHRFALWSGLVQGIGNAGMLLSASPMAWLVEHHGWRTGFLLAAVSAILLAWGVFRWVPRLPEQVRQMPRATLRGEVLDVLRIGLSPGLRAIMVLALVSFASSITIRGMWGGPWLMEIKGLDRVAAGEGLLPLTLALVCGPIVYGVLDRRLGHTAIVLAAGHFIGGTTLIVLALSQTPLGGLLSGGDIPAGFDISMFLVFGIAMGCGPLLFAMGRTQISADQAGKALAAINLSFFCGAALVQGSTGPVANLGGMPGVMAFVGLLLWAAVAYFSCRVGGKRAG